MKKDINIIKVKSVDLFGDVTDEELIKMSLPYDEEIKEFFEDKIILYSNNCPKCRVLKNKLDKAGIKYITESDINKVVNLGYSTIPILNVEGNIMTFNEALKWVNKEGDNGD